MNLAGKPHWRVLPSAVRVVQLQPMLNILDATILLHEISARLHYDLIIKSW